MISAHLGYFSDTAGMTEQKLLCVFHTQFIQIVAWGCVKLSFEFPKEAVMAQKNLLCKLIHIDLLVKIVSHITNRVFNFHAKRLVLTGFFGSKQMVFEKDMLCDMRDKLSVFRQHGGKVHALYDGFRFAWRQL